MAKGENPVKINITSAITPVPAEEAEPTANEEPRVAHPHISFSQLSMYLRCSMQYYYRYILGLKQRPSLSLNIGKGGHTALEYNGRHKIKTGEDLPTNDLLDVASDFIDLQTQELEPSDLKPDEDTGEAKDRALAAIRVYRVRDAAAVHPAGVEVEFNLDINEPNLDPIRIINGKIDLITTSGEVEDYKFVGRARTQAEVDLSPQLTLYGKVFHSLTGKFTGRTGYRMFLPGSSRTPPDSRVIYRDPNLMEPQVQNRRFVRLAHQFSTAERAIREGIFLATDDPITCSWCGYRDRCQSSLVDDYEAAKIRRET